MLVMREATLSYNSIICEVRVLQLTFHSFLTLEGTKKKSYTRALEGGGINWTPSIFKSIQPINVKLGVILAINYVTLFLIVNQ